MAENKAKKVNIHADHRKRVREQFEKDGLKSFPDHNVLEMLLFYSIPRYDTNEIAHNLINEFGSLSAVFEADMETLENVPGIGHESAILIKFSLELFRRYSIDKTKDLDTISDSETAAEYIRPYFIGECEEMFLIVLLDACSCVKKVSIIDRGNEESVAVNIKRVLREAMNSHATSIICAHSHPNGFARPSQEDIIITEELCKKLAGINVRMCDHLIFSRNDVCFLSRERKLVNPRYFMFSEYY